MPEVADRKNGEMPVERMYASYRPYLLGLAYRMLGSVSDAEDVVQELFAAMHEERLTNVSNPKAYLAKAVTHRCLNVLKSAVKRRVTYVGEWLPEPWLQAADDTIDEVVRRDDISYAFLVMLEKLTPLERAVLVLREALDYEYADIAGMLDKTETACRKMLSRAKKKLGGRPASPVPCHPQGERQLVQKWVAALTSGNIEDILALIAEDAVFVTDGGGKVRSAINPIYGRARVAALLRTLATRRFQNARLFIARINGACGIVAVQDEQVIGVTCFDWHTDGTVRHLYTVLNPDKLSRIVA